MRSPAMAPMVFTSAVVGTATNPLEEFRECRLGAQSCW
jgi:hypothetical protein